MSRSGLTPCGVCQSTFASGDCVHIDGDGTTDHPYVATPIISDATNNLVQCGPNGVGGFLPPSFLDPPAVHVYHTAQQTIAWETVQGIIFNSSRYDTDNMHDEEQLEQSSQLNFNTAGVYLVTLNVQWTKTNDNGASGDLALYIRRNGADVIAIDSMPIPNGDVYPKMSLAIEYAFAEGDYVEPLAKQDVIDGDEEPMNLQIDVDRFSPIFAAIFLRPLTNMTIEGLG